MKKLISVSIAVMIFISFENASAQERFEISGSVPKGYEGAEVKVTALGNAAFKEIKTIVRNRKFSLSGYMNEQYERVFIGVARGEERAKGKSFLMTPVTMK